MEKAFGVNRQILINAGYIPKNIKGKAILISLKSYRGFFEFIRKHGEVKNRSGKEGVENNLDFQQMSIYLILVKGNKFAIYKRGTGKQYTEDRLRNKVALGISGHMEDFDVKLSDLLYREFFEEVKVFKKEKLVKSIDELKRISKIKLIGLLKDERDEVGACHIGLVCISKLKKDVNIKIHGEMGKEIYWKFITCQEFLSMKERNEIVPEGWSEFVFKKIIKPMFS